MTSSDQFPVPVRSAVKSNLTAWCCPNLLWPTCVADADIIFLSCGFFLLFYSSPNLSGRRFDVYHTSTHGVASANLECRSEMCCTWLAENAGPKKSSKIRHLSTIAQICRAIFATKVCIGNRKKIIKQQYLPTCLHNMVNFGPLAAEIC